MYPSRYLRPATPRPMRLEPRDRDILQAVHRHRYLTSDHVQVLAFPGVSRRRAQARLRLLFEHGYLDRFYLPLVLQDVGVSSRRPSRPLYCLARRGANIVAEDLGLAVAAIPHTPRQNARGYATLAHHLVVADFLVAVEAAIVGRGDVEIVAVRREHELRRDIAAWQRAHGPLGRFVVSDGALTLLYPRTDAEWSFHLEVVRANVPGGNKTLLAKLAKYAELNRERFFERVFGQRIVRAVLVATTSPERAEGLRTRAATLPHGRGLFWFGSFNDTSRQGVPITSFAPSTILTAPWRDANGETHTLIHAAAGA